MASRFESRCTVLKGKQLVEIDPILIVWAVVRSGRRGGRNVLRVADRLMLGPP